MVITTLIFIVFFLYNSFLDIKYIDAYNNSPKNVYWSSAIYKLIDYTEKNPNKFVSIDWGIHNQLVTFGGKKDKFLELSYWLNDSNYSEKDAEKWFKNEFFNPSNNYAFILHTDNNTFFSLAKKRFFYLAYIDGVRLKLEKEIIDNERQSIFEIYSLEK